MDEIPPDSSIKKSANKKFNMLLHVLLFQVMFSHQASGNLDQKNFYLIPRFFIILVARGKLKMILRLSVSVSF
jgi:hypothetical protein